MYDVRVVGAAYGSRGDVEPMVGLAPAAREPGAGAGRCAPPDEAVRTDGAAVAAARKPYDLVDGEPEVAA
ncbi:hypothetical protein [uncultured Streptomyces sp.]|uniref:hypothetical protein n=1 Tax=uncultured Streptomyces sp. TaxID=174707 RepID=UPI0026131CBF|nr:hypothetical protein [uncultured Streptomyces sp.]